MTPWDVLSDVALRSQHYLAGLGERRAAPAAEALEALAELDAPLQDDPMPAAQIVDDLDRLVAPATTGIGGPRYFGFVNGGAVPAGLAAHWLASAWEQNGAYAVMAPGSVTLERIALRWVVELLGLPAHSQGAFVTGTTTAHVISLAAARHALLARVGWDVEGDGLYGAPPLTVIVGDEVHPTVFKALAALGLGRKRVVRVPVDAQGRMLPDALPELAGPTLVCVQVGNVNTGACDPLRAIAGRVRASAAPAWIHVDGAFGAWARVAPARAHLVDGLELCDSWATDGHKWLNSPYDCGIAIVRDRDALARAMAASADYLPSGNDNPCDFALEMSRRPRGVDAWATLRSLGRSGLAEMVERHCRLAERFAAAFRAAGFPVLNDVVLNQVLVTFGDAERTRQVIAAIQADGTCWCGGTVWQGRTAMRVSVISWATTEKDVDRSVAAILRIARA